MKLPGVVFARLVAFGFNWKRATATAANTAILSSLAVNFASSFASAPPILDPDIAAVMDV